MATKEEIANRNVPLLQAVRDQIALRPATFDMGKWIAEAPVTRERPCGTTACIAGWAVLLSGNVEKSSRYGETSYVLTNVDPQNYFEYGADHDGEVSSVSMFAIKALGLTVSEALTLFYENHWPVAKVPLTTQEHALMLLDRLIQGKQLKKGSDNE